MCREKRRLNRILLIRENPLSLSPMRCAAFLCRYKESAELPSGLLYALRLLQMSALYLLPFCNLWVSAERGRSFKKDEFLALDIFYREARATGLCVRRALGKGARSSAAVYIMIIRRAGMTCAI
ncbi:unnamed protein product [Periconia digitata]|uniref:Uncharacterized protein n=1 Tax=Periconia digitata TaxID=1303443 RepID=A0A9W4XIT5_9PLEO|nr:unnamed protein product [Periconia digitata]